MRDRLSHHGEEMERRERAEGILVPRRCEEGEEAVSMLRGITTATAQEKIAEGAEVS